MIERDDYKTVIRDLASGFRSEAPLPALLERALLASARLWRWWSLGVNAIGRLAPGLTAGRRPGEKPLVAVDLLPVVPGGANGGAKVFTLGLLETMAAMAPDWTFVLVARPEVLPELASLETANLKAVAARGKWTAAPPARLLGRPIDVWFCPFTRPYFQRESIPLVSVIYDLQYRDYPQFFNDAEAQSREQTFQIAARRSSRVACISDFVRGTVLDHSNLPPRKVRTIHISLPERLLGISGRTAQDGLKRLGLSPGRYLVYPANFWPHKNHAVLLTALGIFAKAHPESDLKLVLTGEDTGLATDLKQAAGVMGLSNRVVFTGFVPEEALAELMAQAMALVFPSLYEGYGMPVAEAMCMGVPVLCSGVTSLPEVGGDAALYFDPRRPEDVAAAIARIHDEPELAGELSSRGRQRAVELGTSRDMARAYLELLDEAMRDLGVQSAVCDGVDRTCVQHRVFAAFGPAPTRQCVAAEFLNEGTEPVGCEAFLDGKLLLAPRTLVPGEKLALRRPVSPYGGCLEFFFTSSSPKGPVPGLRCRKLALEGRRDHDFLGNG